MRTSVSSVHGMPASTSRRPAVEEWTSCPLRETTICQPGS
jgi:hypothetical protein